MKIIDATGEKSAMAAIGNVVYSKEKGKLITVVADGKAEKFVEHTAELPKTGIGDGWML